MDDAIGNNKVIKGAISAAKLMNLGLYVTVNLEMDYGTLDYYYSINVDDLLNSEMPITDLEDLKEQGWAYDETRDNIIIFLT